MNLELKENGFIVIPGVFQSEQIKEMRSLCYQYFSDGGGFKNAGGHAKPDWIKESNLKKVLDLYQVENIRNIITENVGEEVHFIGHNDLHLNRSVGWHKDRLNGETRKFEVNSPWEKVDGETMKIYKVNLYLQDHSNNNDGFTVRVGSHSSPNMNEGHIKQIYPNLGDIILFDQRITHMAKWSGGYNRFLICMGFGVKNCFFEQFKKGTEFRQNKQNGIL
tara:strand:- start:56222 stop:56881 length:660 start_codon:yes stop_codon:yes gene_type:complete